MIKEYIKLKNFQIKWKKKNKHNYTVPFNIFDSNFVSIGKGTYGELNILQYNKKSHLIIGDYCSIGPNTVFILDADHHTNFISTYPFKVRCGMEKYEAVSKGDIIIEDDVWIGYGSIILSGVRIEQGAIIAAGSVVTKNIPAYSIVGGSPAKVIKQRFSEELIKEFKKIDYSKIDKDFIIRNIRKFYLEIESEEQLEFLPKKANRF